MVIFKHLYLQMQKHLDVIHVCLDIYKANRWIITSSNKNMIIQLKINMNLKINKEK